MATTNNRGFGTSNRILRGSACDLVGSGPTLYYETSPAHRCAPVNEQRPPVTHAQLTPELLSLVRAIRAAKAGAGRMYAALGEQMPSFEGRLAVEQLARDEAEHAARLERLVGSDQRQLARPTPVGCGLHDEGWPSALLAAFALDQAA